MVPAQRLKAVSLCIMHHLPCIFDPAHPNFCADGTRPCIVPTCTVACCAAACFRAFFPQGGTARTPAAATRGIIINFPFLLLLLFSPRIGVASEPATSTEHRRARPSTRAGIPFSCRPPASPVSKQRAPFVFFFFPP